jgi:hypothetical protein
MTPAQLVMNRYLTIGQCASLLGVASRTVGKWFDDGKLKGFRLPSTSNTPGKLGPRRVTAKSLSAFCQRSNIPDPFEGLLGQQAEESQETQEARGATG